jgi:hypothetical protein
LPGTVGAVPEPSGLPRRRRKEYHSTNAETAELLGFDRIIVSCAKANGLPSLVSSDEAIRKNYVKTAFF